MRLKHREVTDPEKIKAILDRCHCCRVGFCKSGQVYIVPLSFGYIANQSRYTFYFHGASQGRKAELIKSDPQVGFELDTNYKLNPADSPCGYSARFQSVIGSGTIRMVTNEQEKELGLSLIMTHTTRQNQPWHFSQARLKSVCVFKLDATELSCKEHL